MFTLQFLPSISATETVSCRHCNTHQYPRNGVCVRCRRPLELHYVSLRIDALPNPDLEVSKKHLARVIGMLLRSLRKRRGMCQSQLASRTAGCITRTSLSKAECGHMLIPLYKLLPLARTLGLTAVILRFDGAAIHAADQSTNRG